MTRLVPAAPAVPARGVRVVIDARPMQEPERSPLTAWYLEQLLRAFAADPLEGESFVVVSRALRPDPADELAAAGLPVAASRRIPPTTRALRSAGLTLDTFLLRGAELRAAGGDDGLAVFHTAGGAVPLASRLPVVATILDLAPWELPDTYAASPAARFGHRLRARVLRDAARVIVCSRATGESARRQLRVPADRISVVPLAVDADVLAAAHDPESLAGDRAGMSLPPRYLVFSGRYDARKDMRTLFRALSLLRARGAPPDGTSLGDLTGGNGRSSGNGRAYSGERNSGAPTLVMALDSGQADERQIVSRAVEAHGLEDLVRVVGVDDARQRAAVIAGAEAFVYPSLSEAAAAPVLEALRLGVPVICSRAGALPETVGSAGIVVEPRDPSRMAAALEAIWAGGALAEQLRRQARRRAESATRTWADVARETRSAYLAAAEPAVRPSGSDPEGSPRSGIRRFAVR